MASTSTKARIHTLCNLFFGCVSGSRVVCLTPPLITRAPTRAGQKSAAEVAKFWYNTLSKNAHVLRDAEEQLPRAVAFLELAKLAATAPPPSQQGANAANALLQQPPAKRARLNGAGGGATCSGETAGGAGGASASGGDDGGVQGPPGLFGLGLGMAGLLARLEAASAQLHSPSQEVCYALCQAVALGSVCSRHPYGVPASPCLRRF